MKSSILSKYCIYAYFFLLLISQSIIQSTALTGFTSVVQKNGNQKNLTVQIIFNLDHSFATFGSKQPVNGPIVFLDQFNNQTDDDDTDHEEMCVEPTDLTDDQMLALQHKIFVIRRSYKTEANSCSFMKKAQIAESLGAKAVIIANRPVPEQSDDDTYNQLIDESISDSSGQPLDHVDPYAGYGDQLMQMLDDGSHTKIGIDVVAITSEGYNHLHDMFYEQSINQTVFVDIDVNQSLSQADLVAIRWFSVMAPFLVSFMTLVRFVKSMKEYYDEQSVLPTSQSNQVNPGPDFIPEELGPNDQSNDQSNSQSLNLPEDDEEDDLDFDDDLDELINQSNNMSLRDRFDEMIIRLCAYLAKPNSIHWINQSVYLLECISSLAILVVYWSEMCSSDLHALAALFFCRAVMGARIAYWQTHSDTPPPSCTEVFVKNWCDYVFLFTGSVEVWSAGDECSLNSAHLLRFGQLAVLIISATYLVRIGLFLTLKCTSLHTTLAQQEQGGDINEAADVNIPANAPSDATGNPVVTQPSHLFSLGRVFLDVLNGGFYCAGQLDTARPATAMDLRWLPTVRYKPGLSFKRGSEPDQQDMSCSICMQDYEPGEVIRLLYCQRKAIHHFHQGCVDQWLLRNATCPLCRSAVSQERSEQQRQARLEMRERRQRRERRVSDEQQRGGYQQVDHREDMEIV